MGNQLEFIPLDIYEKNLNSYHPNNQEKIKKAVEERLSFNPKHGQMLIGKQTVSGAKLIGLRHFKIGIKGVKKGAVVYYRYCKECLENSYYLRSDVQCQFCDKEKPDRIILFLVDLRSAGYG
jgi:hypothetical protein